MHTERARGVSATAGVFLILAHALAGAHAQSARGANPLAAKAHPAAAQLPAGVPTTNTSYIDQDGTAHVTRVVPVPDTVSPQAQAQLARRISDIYTPQPIAATRAQAAAFQESGGRALRAVFPVNIREATMAGVPVRELTPINPSAAKQDRVLMNLHGGGFTGDWGSLTETIPIANLTGTRVVAVLYRLAPEHKFPAAVDDAVAVYKELLKSYKPEKILIYGTSAGAILTTEVAARLRQLGLPLPAGLGVFSGGGDFSKVGDTFRLFGVAGLAGPLWPDAPDTYSGSTDPKDPVLSPVYSDLKGYPPVLLISSTRDFLLSETALYDRALLAAGDTTQLVVFEALNHAFWNDGSLPESREAYALMAGFFDRCLNGSAAAAR